MRILASFLASLPALIWLRPLVSIVLRRLEVPVELDRPSLHPLASPILLDPLLPTPDFPVSFSHKKLEFLEAIFLYTVPSRPSVFS